MKKNRHFFLAAFVYVLGLCISGHPTAQAETMPLAPHLQDLQDHLDQVHTLTVHIDINNSKEDMHWQLSTVEQQVFFGRLFRQPPARHPDDAIFDQISQPTPAYKGIIIEMTNYKGDKLPSLRVYNRTVTDLNGHTLRKDPGRELELWLFGTAHLLKEQLLATQVIPIFSFKQCLLLGNMIIETSPRQCLLPNNNLLLDVPERPTAQQLKIQTFDDCLEHGKALIDVFPRRCLAAGGRVFTEPPRLIDTSSLSTTPTSPDKPVDIDAFLKEYKGSAEGQ